MSGDNGLRVEVVDKIALWTLGTADSSTTPSVLGQKLRSALLAEVDRLEGRSDLKALIIIGGDGGFPVGPDLAEFDSPSDTDTPDHPPKQAPIKRLWLTEVCDRIEDLPIPVIAAIKGSAMGTALELALACHYRLADERARLGFPDIALGLVPHSGGTQRAPRLIGAGPTLDMMLSGAPVTAARGLSMGLLDKVVDGPLREAALAYADELLAEGIGPRPGRDQDVGFADPGAYWQAVRKHKDAVGRRTGPVQAARYVIQCVEAAQMMSFEQGVTLERDLFEECLASEDSLALRYIHTAEQRAATPPEATDPQASVPKPITTVGVIGAGLMGGGIALALSAAGLQVNVVERSGAALKAGIARMATRLDRALAKGKLAARVRDAQWARITFGTDLSSLAQLDLVIEAVAEDFDIKSEVLFKLGQIAKDGMIFASNTSYLDIDGLAQKTGRPGDTLGLHFFSPADRMPLVEVVAGTDTSDQTLATGFALVKALGKAPVLAQNGEGFIGNAVLTAYRAAADILMEDGANPAEIDQAMRDFGFAMGPYQVLDMAGLDISWARRQRQAEDRDPNERYVDIGDQLCARGWFGRKAGRGYYAYPDGSPIGIEDPEVAALIDETRLQKGIIPTQFSAEVIQSRCLLAMINAGARLVAEDVAQRPSDIDTVMVHGFGFPRWRGGPMYMADQVGLHALAEELDVLSEVAPSLWAPTALILQLADEGRSLSDLNGV